ncbi:hypothetical protein [Jiella avicenniae]|uniref:Uncharacterized protein n=1 Tax=Jiella avicenniae TaxID=2907202 RepID=A0A9X1P134_9HYPH|nr:hypothetical protein [Jiella avicenniae]MCE7027844.1 hypothetical protein [Jiella avicenniae]
MAENLTFHFEGALAETHQMNFYEAARFQYAAARLMVKLAQFRRAGKFVQKITNNSNFNINLKSQEDGSFNINIEDEGQSQKEEKFVDVSLADLVAYVSERVIEKIDESSVSSSALAKLGDITDSDHGDSSTILTRLIQEVDEGRTSLSDLPEQVRELVKRRVAETYRERRLSESKAAISKIDFARSQKLIAMSAPLMSEMATALRKSANTLEVTSSVGAENNSVLFLNRQMAQEIETASVDKDITPLLGDITQFNKDNGWGKLKIANVAKAVSFSIPYDILPAIKSTIIENMKKDLVYLQTYFVRDRSDELIRLIAVGVLPTPKQ